MNYKQKYYNKNKNKILCLWATSRRILTLTVKEVLAENKTIRNGYVSPIFISIIRDKIKKV